MSQCSLSGKLIIGLHCRGAFVTDTIITLVYLYHLRRTLWGQNETSDSVCFVIGRVLIRSASYTTVFAAITAVLAQQFGDKNIY